MSSMLDNSSTFWPGSNAGSPGGRAPVVRIGGVPASEQLRPITHRDKDSCYT
jgi:hypothetical protein